MTANSDGSYSIKKVAGPDEYSNGVDDGVFTNAGAALALRNATRAAAILGEKAPANWTVIADHLRMPFDAQNQAFLQYDGYEGTQIKQADTVLLLYPLEWPMSTQVAADTLDYYAPRTDPDGPAMTDAIHAVDAAQIGEPGCATHTYLMRSIRPFVRDPFAQFTEARGDKAGAQDPLAGSPAYNFLTGSGGFSQVFTFGLTGLRWREDRVHLDPMLPPQLSSGVTLKGLHWRGRTFDIADRGEQHEGDASRRRRIHARVAGRDANGELDRNDPHAPARPDADGQPRPLPARHRDLRGGGRVRGGGGGWQRRDGLVADGEPREPHRRSRQGDPHLERRDDLGRHAARDQPHPDLDGRVDVDRAPRRFDGQAAAAGRRALRTRGGDELGTTHTSLRELVVR